MRYTVVWVPSAVQELAKIWNQSSARQSVADAADEIDRELSRSPERVGVDWGDGQRYLNVAPLAVIFTVATDDRLVTVFDVWYFP